MVLLAGFSWGLWGQGALECGSIVAPVPTVTDPDSLVYDRFGNAYYWRDLIIKEASVASSLNSSGECNTGYFNLIFEPEVSTEMRAVANAVFCYLSEVIIQRTNITPCGETWPQSEVDVHIRMQNLDSNIAAQGTPFFSAPNPIYLHGMRHSRPFMIINGGTATQFGTEIYDAEIDINSNAAVTWNLDWNIPTPPTQHDLFTAILHEALHTLGFASLLGNNRVSIWDVNLFSTPEFPETPNVQALLNSDVFNGLSCGRNNWEHNYYPPTNAPYVNNATNNCLNNLPDIVIGATGIAPVYSSGGAGLSHLNSPCGGVNYVMDPQLSPGLAGTRRTITAPELEILCALGYQTTTCNGYYNIAHAEETNNMMGCCATPLIVCLNEPGSNIFSMDQLLCNDFSNLQQAVTYVNFFGPETTSFPPLEISGTNIIVPNGISPGVYRFMYTATAQRPDGQCLMHDVRSTITILDCSPYNCAPTEEPCDNLLCVNDFENLPTGKSMGITTPVITFEGYSEFSTADIFTNEATGNNVLYLGHGNSQEDQDAQSDTREAVTYQLANGIPPGCSLIVNLDVGLFISVLNSTNFTLNFWGSTTEPCSTDGVITRINNACDVDNLCMNGSIFHPYCMGALTVTNILSGFPNNLNALEHRTMIWENNTNDTIQFLTLVSGTEEERGGFVIDNLEARIECRPIISCRLLNEEDICSEGISALTWELCSGVGTTLTTNITLPSGVTAVDPNQLSQTIQIPEDGGCIEVSIDITTTLPDGGHFSAAISGIATGICANMEFGCKEDLAVVDCTPDPCVTTCSLTTTEICSGQPSILTWRVCADGAVGSGTSTATVNITLPQGVTAVNPAQLTQTVQIPAGECVEVNVEVTTTLTVGSSALFSLTGVASGTCAEAAFGCEEKIIVVDCTPDPCVTTCALTTTELCSDQPTILTWRVCADGAVGSGTSTATVNITLPQGITAVNPAQLTQTVQIPAGECVEVNVEVTTTLAVGSFPLFSLTGVASGTCAEAAFGCEEKIMVIDCTPPGAFTCPCTTPGSINIDAGAGTLLSSILEFSNLPNGTLNLDEFGHCLGISGKLIIDKSIIIRDQFGNGESVIRMNPGAEIEVNTNRSLQIYDTDIHGCSKMWRGITVLPRGRLYLQANNIYDAQYAVKAIPSETAGLIKPTLISIRRNKFINNHVGVLVTEGSLLSDLRHIPFDENQFYTAQGATLLPQYDMVANYNNQSGYAGVVVQNPQFSVGANNKFSSLRNGIISENCRLEINSCYFNGISGTPPANPTYINGSAGIAVLANNGQVKVLNSQMSKLHTGLFSTNNPVIASGNTINGAVRGVECHSPWSMEVKSNIPIEFKEYGIIARDINPVVATGGTGIFDISSNELYSTNAVPFSNDRWAIEINNADEASPATGILFRNVITINDQTGGIQISNSNGWSILTNRVLYEHNPNGEVISSTAFHFDHSSDNVISDNLAGSDEAGVADGATSRSYLINMGQQNTLCCNTASKMTTGFEFLGTCTDSEFRFNTIEGTQTSLLCQDHTRIGVQDDDNGNLFMQWSGTAKHLGDEFDINESRFVVYDENGNLMPDDTPYAPEGIIAAAEWFIPDSDEDGTCEGDNICENATPGKPGGTIKSGDLLIVAGPASEKPRDLVQYWEGIRNLYRRMNKFPGMHLENSDIDVFYDEAQTGKIGQYHSMEQYIHELNVLPAVFATELGTIYTALSANDLEVNQRAAALGTVTTWADSLDIYSDIDSLRQQITPQLYALRSISDKTRQYRQMGAENLLAQVVELPADNIVEQNRKAVYAVYLHTLAKGQVVLSEEDFATVTAIAHQCPLEGGSAVYLARGLYQYNDRKEFNDLKLCDTEGHERSSDKPLSRTGTLKVIPNPANDWVDIVLPGMDANSSIYMVDVSGRTVYPLVVSRSEGRVQLQLTDMPQGLYFCTLTLTDGSRQTAKVFIQH